MEPLLANRAIHWSHKGDQAVTGAGRPASASSLPHTGVGPNVARGRPIPVAMPARHHQPGISGNSTQRPCQRRFRSRPQPPPTPPAGHPHAGRTRLPPTSSRLPLVGVVWCRIGVDHGGEVVVDGQGGRDVKVIEAVESVGRLPRRNAYTPPSGPSRGPTHTHEEGNIRSQARLSA